MPIALVSGLFVDFSKLGNPDDNLIVSVQTQPQQSEILSFTSVLLHGQAETNPQPRLDPSTVTNPNPNPNPRPINGP